MGFIRKSPVTPVGTGFRSQERKALMSIEDVIYVRPEQGRENLFDKGVMVYSYSENIDLSTSMGRAMLTIISAFAQLERDIIRERTLAGLARAKAQGKKLGRPRKKRGYVIRGVNTPSTEVVEITGV